MKAALNNLSKQNPLMLAAAAALLVWVVYSLARKALGDVADGLGGVFSGNNAATKGTAYEGAGLAGTAGAVVDSITGGLTSGIGEWIAGVLPVKDTLGDSVYYVVNFPGGVRHAVPASTVAKSGAFTYEGVRYVLGTQDGKHVARAA